MTSASRLGTPRALTIAAALAAVLLVAAAAFLLLGNDAPQRYSGEGVPYIDIDGSTGYRLGAVEIDQTDFVSFPHALDDSGPSGGWYLVKGNIFLTAPLAVSGDVRLIMGSGATLTVTGADNSIAVASGSLSVYAQPKGAMGRVVVTGGCGVELSAGTSLVNTASIASTLPGGCGAHAYGTASITNGATGVIRGGSEGIWLDAGGTVDNLGTVSATEAFASGIDSHAYAEVSNAGRIQSSYSGVSLRAGGTVDNSGTITGAEHGIETGGAAVTINNLGAGVIEGNSQGIYIGAGGVVDNSGTIRCKDPYCDGVYAAAAAEVINSGVIQGTWGGVCLNEGGAVTNCGTLTGIQGNGISAYRGAAAVFNTGLVHGGASGISLEAGGDIDNFGTVAADGNGNAIGAASGAAPVTLRNAGTIKGGVTLPDAANAVTFTAGSRVEGRFDIGGDTGSTLTFDGTLEPSLLYSVVTGGADLGNARVYIDGTGLPLSLTGGVDIVLIDASPGSVTAPANSEVSAGAYTFSLVVEGKKLVAKAPPNRISPR